MIHGSSRGVPPRRCWRDRGPDCRPVGDSGESGRRPEAGGTGEAMGLEFIDTGFETPRPLWCDVVDDVVRIHLLYDHERASPNRAAGTSISGFMRAGAKLTLEFLNLDNVWNGQPGSVAAELKTVAISEDGRTWKTTCPLRAFPAIGFNSAWTCAPRSSCRAHGTLSAVGPRSILGSIRGNRLVQITPIGEDRGRRSGDRPDWQPGPPPRVRPRACTRGSQGATGSRRA